MPSMKIPKHWSPNEALAVFEFIDELREQIWNTYGLEIQAQMKAEQVTEAEVSDDDQDF